MRELPPNWFLSNDLMFVRDVLSCDKRTSLLVLKLTRTSLSVLGAFNYEWKSSRPLNIFCCRWAHQVTAVYRNIAVNIWWTPLNRFNSSDCEGAVDTSSEISNPFRGHNNVKVFCLHHWRRCWRLQSRLFQSHFPLLIFFPSRRSAAV